VEIATLSPWWGIGAILLMGSVLGGWAACQRNRSVRRARVDDLVRALCDLNAKVATDPTLAALLIAFTESPSELDRVERVRARAWFDSARRLHRLLHAALGHEVAPERTRSMWIPSMGEAAGGTVHVARGPTELQPDRGGPSNITLIDPEFMAWTEAMRDLRST